VSLISFVVPVHNVEGSLRECLDSVLGQTYADVELIAVDDASADGGPRILAECAARDPRVTVVTLDRGIGPGPARNRGFEAATGAYVWYLDGDDCLAPGIVGTVAERIRDVDPDVVIVDRDRRRGDGEIMPSPNGGRFGWAPPVFALHEWPETIEIPHVSRNKVVRRALLDRLGLRFDAGWYEDVPFTYGLLTAAERITLLDRVGVYYRQRRGAATRTVGDGHFAIFRKWARVFDRFDGGRPGAERLRGLLFRQMIWHFLQVSGDGERLPEDVRERFFAEMTACYLRYLPPGGYPRPRGVEGVKHRLVAAGRFRAFRALGRVYRAAGTARTAGGAVAIGAARAGRGTLRAGRTAALRAYYHEQRRQPCDPTLALYAAYRYRGYACNPAAVYERARALVPDVHGVWVVRRDQVRSMPPGVPYVVAGTPAYYRALARATWLVNNVDWPTYVVKRPGSVHLMTHHGTPLKVMGLDRRDYPGGVSDHDFVGQMARADRWDFSVSANSFTTRIWQGAYPCRYRTLETGYPRNDRLALATPEEVARVRAALGIAPHQPVVLYAPTYREHAPAYRPPLDPEQLRRAVGPDAVLLTRSLHVADRDADHDTGAEPWPASEAGGVRDVSAYPAVEDLYLAADVLVTDYSSAMFDYAVLDRPIVIYAPDWEAYRAVRGVYFDVVAEPPGAVALSFPELLDTFHTGLVEDDAATKARDEFRRRFCALDDGHAAERVVRRVFLGEA
jgi:CDP-glycerol glycerophosphotransferase